MASEKGWNKVFRDCDIENHDSDRAPLELNAGQIKRSCQKFTGIAIKSGRYRTTAK